GVSIWAGSGGNGLSANNSHIIHLSGASISGGDGGDGDYRNGNGGVGIDLYAGHGFTSRIENNGTIRGGASGARNGSNDGTTYGRGGVGVSVGGEGGYIVNAGLIAGGTHKDRTTTAKAVELFGDNHTLELRAGYAFTGAVTASGSGNTLLLGGDAPASTAATDDISGFDTLGLTGTAAWTLDAGMAQLDFSGTGKTLAIDLTGFTGQPLLAASANLLVDTDTAVELSGTAALLYVGDTVVLVSGLVGATATVTGVELGRRRFEIGTNGAGELLAEVLSLTSFTDIQSALPGLDCPNLIAGAAYLDRVESAGAIDPALMQTIETNWQANLDLGGDATAIGLNQFYGSYAAYANTGLATDAARFRRIWQARSRSFLDSFVLTGTDSVSSDSGYASLRDVQGGMSRIWAGGFGSWAKQESKNTFAGYKYDSQGAALGYEYSAGNLNLGFAAAYSRGDLKVSDLRYKNEADLLNLAVYGTYVHQSGFYGEAGLGYGHGWNKYHVDAIAVPGGKKKGRYGSDAVSASLELGYIAALPQKFTLIPSLGAEYRYLRNSGWSESVTDPALAANRFASGHEHALDIPVGLRFNRLFRFGCDGGYIIPEVRASFIYQANRARPSILAGFADAGGVRNAGLRGVDPGRSHWRLGAAVSGRFNSRIDFSLEYEYQIRSGYDGHDLNAEVGVAF
ncbi:MAG: autotransporter domain-containing protein, partial [Planctomycetes bacterium]|nr:autotransporter domain-containing protein [Planctomycetota bacterium]